MTAVMGRSPFGAGHVTVVADGLVSVGSEIPGSDSTGLAAVLPLAVHNKWVLLHDPRGPANRAEIVLLVSGSSDTAARQRIYDEVSGRAPALLSALRLRAVGAGLAVAGDGGTDEPASPFGSAGPPPSASGYDPFAGDTSGAPGQSQPRPPSSCDPFDPFAEGT